MSARTAARHRRQDHSQDGRHARMMGGSQASKVLTASRVGSRLANPLFDGATRVDTPSRTPSSRGEAANHSRPFPAVSPTPGEKPLYSHDCNRTSHVYPL